MQNRKISKVAVLGSGVMGSRIACHFAGIGVQVLLLDIVPKDLAPDAKPAERNKIVNDALAAAIKSNPSPVFHKDVVKKISTGNSNTRPTPSVTLTNRSKYSVTDTIGWMLISRPMPSRNSRP